MANLTRDHIDYITKDLHYRGIVLEGAEHELLDHICSAVEQDMDKGTRFIEAYRKALQSFGYTRGLRETQKHIIENDAKFSGMLRNHLLIATRNHMKNKFFTLINVTGLATGIASCMVILLFVINELSYDRFHEKGDRIYRVYTEIKVGEVHHQMGLAAAKMHEMFLERYPEIESSVRMIYWGSRFVQRPGQPEKFREDMAWADSTFFQVFTVPVLEGDPRTALREPNTIAISRRLAYKYFPTGNALGHMLVVDDTELYKVTAVYEDLPYTSHFHFDALRSIANHSILQESNLLNGGEVAMYLLLREGTDPRQLEAKFPAFVNEHVAPELAVAMQGDFTMDNFLAAGNKWQYWLTPLTDLHLYPGMDGDFEPGGSTTYVYLFSAIALLILGIACVNFMNLSTARSASRAKEVGVRKVMGSLRSHLVRQFLTESFILSLISFMLAIGLAHLFLPVFNMLAQKELQLPFSSVAFYAIIAAAAIVVGIAAGLYPAFVLSSFKPAGVLKGRVAVGNKSLVRSALVVFQFSISIFLIVGAIAVQRQLEFFQSKSVGYDKSQVIIVHETAQLGKQIQAFKDEVLRSASVTAGTISGFIPVQGSEREFNTYWPEGKAPTGSDMDEMVTMHNWQVDDDYLTTMGIRLKSGRFFSKEFPSDSTGHVVLNEAAVAKFGLGENPIGKKISRFTEVNSGPLDPNSVRSWTVIGVVEDFHFQSLRDEIMPLGFFLGSSPVFVSFRFEGRDTQAVVEAVQSVWSAMLPDKEFSYSFLDENFYRMYSSERRLGTIFGVFAALAIVIACLGLFALTAFAVERRTKEIGIRKTLGASMKNIVVLLSRDYGRLIAMAFIISTPVAWYSVNKWLEGYPYRTQIGVSVYLLAGAIAGAVAVVTIAYHCVKAARTNPTTSLRSE